MIDFSLPRTLAGIRAGFAAGLHSGAQLYVSLRGQVIADVALGEARPDQRMATDTLMVWLSAGKPITAVAIGQLVERGKVAWDDPVARHIPEFAGQGKEAVTIRHLLTHTAGLRLVRTNWPHATWDETIAVLCAAPMEKDWAPGQKAGYHAYTSWYLLGELVHQVDGRRIEAYLREEVFVPLGMADSWLCLTPAQYAAYGERIGVLYRTTGGHQEPMKLDTLHAATRPRPAGSVRGPVRELGRFYEALFRGGAPILRSDTVALMTSRQRSGMFDQTFKARVDWGLGFQVNSEHITPSAPYGFGPYASPETFGHGGSQSSVGMCDPARGLVVALVYNGCPGELEHNRRVRAFFTTLYEELGFAS